MKKKMLPVAVVVGLIALILAICGITALVKKYSPSKERLDLKEYYSVSADDQVAIILQQELKEEKAILINNNVYLDYNFVHKYINPRYYWDANENILLYATDKELISAEADSNSYMVTKNTVDFGKTVVKATSDSAYISIDFVALNSDFQYNFYTEPNRITIYKAGDELDVATMKKSTAVRQKGGIKSPILADIEKGAAIDVLEEDETWTKVMTEDGVIGYVKSKYIVDNTTKVIEASLEEETFSHIQKDFKINMAWHQVTAYAANGDIANVLSSTKGVNVISPTWFYLNDNNGSIADLASTNYVNYCHQQGVEVWALVSNLENSEVDTASVLTHTSTRTKLINQIVAAAIKYELDGINLDFEALDSSAVGEAYIEFVRELSIKLGNNGIVFSIDNYVPTSYTAFYDREEQGNFADYVVIMGYDQHYSGSDSGSVAGLDWVTEGVENTLKEVPSNQVILGMPFYTRVWALTPKEEAENNEVTEEGSEADSYNVTSQVYSMTNAAKLVQSYQAEITWDATNGQDFSTWENDGTTYKVWLENSSSFEARLALIDKYSLAGASYWKLGLESSSIWDTVIKYIN